MVVVVSSDSVELFSLPSIQNQVWRPDSLMQRILGEIHYMPDSWKQKPHTTEVYNEFTHVFQFTVVSHPMLHSKSPLH